jgi:hypothetical protein
MARWYVDRRELDWAKRYLGLKHEVAIHFNHGDQYGGWGFYDSEAPDPHHVYVWRSLDLWNANRVLWHELGHALQVERDFNGVPQALGNHSVNLLIQMGLMDNNYNRLGFDVDPFSWWHHYEQIETEQEALDLEKRTHAIQIIKTRT